MSTSDVEDRAAGAADELGLAGLVVHAADDALARARVVVLDELVDDAQLAEHARAEGLDEETAFVAVDRGGQQDRAGELGRERLHHASRSDDTGVEGTVPLLDRGQVLLPVNAPRGDPALTPARR